MSTSIVTAIIEELSQEPTLKNDDAALLKAIILNLHMSPDALREIHASPEFKMAMSNPAISITSDRNAPLFMAVGETTFNVDGATAKDFFDCADLIQAKLNCSDQVAEIAEMVLIQRIQKWFYEREDSKPIPVQGFRPGMVIN
ncbi:hypothetical protein SAMN05660443_1921 [Marinospirillum celere]|uniref:Uncharacterized protein n=1 Tax=Marinospirillum celere TaxID=1122252 RepID=A0A1I1HBA5_9GAMM|nr:hypothetical protein [Marinospirillum celere]SFC21439.1 hypothetical protein SAMN05660443_1921 [Marinospirillum celere]